jgi:hypothetical protein
MSRATRELRRQYEALTEQADVLREGWRPGEALARYREALNYAERLAADDGRHEFDVLRTRADIGMLEGFAELSRGWGASAVILFDQAVNALLHLLRESGRRSDERGLTFMLSRALLVNAHALIRYGDPDIAGRSADLAFRAYLGQHRTRGWNVADMGALASGASAILARAGRLADALDADGVAVKAAGETAESTGSDDDRRWLATALARWSMHLLATGDGEHRLEAADRLADAREVDVAIAVELLPRSPAEGLRVGLESHYLFNSGALVAPLGERETADWAGLILACCRALDNAPDQAEALPLAVDLASHNMTLIDVLVPHAGDDPGLGPLLRDCVDHHAQLMDRADDQASAARLRETAAALGLTS